MCIYDYLSGAYELTVSYLPQAFSVLLAACCAVLVAIEILLAAFKYYVFSYLLSMLFTCTLSADHLLLLRMCLNPVTVFCMME